MASSVTITADTGPAVQNTSIVLSDVKAVHFDLVARALQVNQSAGVIKEYDLVGVTTVTFSISGADYTITIS